MKKILGLSVALLLLLMTVSALCESTDSWKQGYYVDEFNERTGEKYAYIDVQGTFSNTAATNEKLSAKIIVDLNSIQIYMLEYETYKVTNFFSNPTYTIRVKDGSDTIHTFNGFFSESSSRISIYNEQKAELMNVLKEGGRIRFSITDDNMTSSTYTFSINNANNFDTQWSLALGMPIGYMGSFSEGVVIVTYGDKMGALDTTGNLVIPCIYDIVSDCHDGVLRVFNGEYLTVDGGSRMYNGGAGQFGFIGRDGTQVTECEYENAYNFSCGRAFVKKNGKWGCIDTNGNVVILFQYDFVYSYNEDIALVYSGTLNKMGYPSGGHYSYINLDGNTIYENDEGGYDFSEGLARVKVNGKVGYINTNGELAIDAKWSNAGSFSNGRAWVESNAGISFINIDGEEIAKCDYSNIRFIGSFSDGLAYIADNKTSRYGFLNEQGKLVIPCQYRFVGNFQNGYAFVQNEDKKYGIIDKNGGLSVPCLWDEIQNVGQYFRVRKFATINQNTGAGVGGTYGLIDAQGNVVLECIYSSINYGEGYYTVSKEKDWLVFDESMNRVF